MHITRRIATIVAALAIGAGTVAMAPAAQAITLGASKLIMKCPYTSVEVENELSAAVSPDGTVRGVLTCATGDLSEWVFYVAISPNGTAIYRRLMATDYFSPQVSNAVDDGAGSLYFVLNGEFIPASNPIPLLIKVNERTLATPVVDRDIFADSVVVVDGKWGAVSQSGMELYEDGPLFGRSAPARITFNAVVDSAPHLAHDGKRVVMVWCRAHGQGGGDVDLWVATRTRSGWSSRLFQKNAGNCSGPSIAAGGGNTVVSWSNNSGNFTSDNVSGAWKQHSYAGSSINRTPQVSVSSSVVAQSWTSNSGPSGQHAYVASGFGTNWGTATRVSYPSTAEGAYGRPDGTVMFIFWAGQSHELRFSVGTG